MSDEQSDLEMVSISALNQYVFCPRRCALTHVEGMWADNEHTVIGSLLHDRADEPGHETDDGVTLLRSLPLYSKRRGLTGKADIVERRDGELIPVEYKKGKRRRFDNDDIQLCAQALCLEEMFATKVARGFIYHATSRRRREVTFDERLREKTERTIVAVREMLATGRVPAAELKPRCDGCSLREICMPELTSVTASTELLKYQRELISY
jgi:CRISPR-associated exonuclease Cas4